MTLRKNLAASLIALLCAGCALPGPTPSTRTPPAVQTPAVAALLAQSQQAAVSGHPQQAEGLIERALRIEPQNATLWQALAGLRLARHPKEARALAAKSNALTQDPVLQAQNWHLISQAWAALGHPGRAAQADSRAQALGAP